MGILVSIPFREAFMQTVLTLSHAEARRGVEAIQAELERRGKSAVIAVTDAHGELLAFLRMDGAPVSSINIAINKAFTAARERSATRTIGLRSRDAEDGFPMTNFGDLRYINWTGGLPVLVEGKVTGAIAVSGLTGDEDEELAEIGRRAILGG